MRWLVPFRSVKTRLLALMAFVILPIAVLTVVLATAADQSLRTGMEQNWRESTEDDVVRTHIWLRGSVRTLVAAVAAVAAQGEDCSQTLGAIAQAAEGYEAIEVDQAGGRSCSGERSPELAPLLAAASQTLRDKPRAAFPDGRTVAFSIFSDTRGRYLALQVGSPPSSSPAWTTTALLEPTLLDLLLAPNSASSDAVALMQRGGAVIATSGAQAGDIGWLPKTEAITENYAIVNAPSRSGASFDYATAGVLGEQYYILRRFDTSGMRLAWLRFLVLSLAPLATLATLYIVYSWAIQSEILRWIEGIKLAILARRRGQGERAFAPMDVAMPTELRDFASTFNEMARESAIREDSLKRSLTENEFLLRELHHRVKNSLQIIQSYLSLTRRLDSASSESIAIAAMEARVQVLSIAYRKAFSEGRMRDVRIRLFAEELTRNLAQSFRRPGLSLELDADITTALMIDRAIPMGLALVEAVMAGLRTSGPRAIRVALSEGADRRLELRITTDGALPANMPDGRLMSGLALQLGAEVEPCGPGEILHWRFQGAPPPMVKPLEEAASRPVDVVETRRPQRLA